MLWGGSTLLDAIYHTSVVIFEREFFYGQGIMSAIPGTTQHGQPIERVDMGTTEIPQEVFMEFMDNMRETYTADAYHLLGKNQMTGKIALFAHDTAVPPPTPPPSNDDTCVKRLSLSLLFFFMG
jgi:hypothetical protein